MAEYTAFNNTRKDH